ncbi:MAG: hypothetical protein R2737_04455 [Candidatus Nanopelagicales bacterium]
MGEPRPTLPLPEPERSGGPGSAAGDEPTSDAGGTGCRHGHAPTRSPVIHPRLGMVPSLSNAIVGLVVLVLAVGVTAWLLPPVVAAVLLVLAALALAFSAAVQLALGHRGRCWAERTVRWWLGPIGTLLDPFDVG